MSTDFTGTNPEKIDKLVVTIIELRTTLRICFAVIGIGFPLMVGLLTFLVLQSFGTSSKIDRLNDQISVVRVITRGLPNDWTDSKSPAVHKLGKPPFDLTRHRPGGRGFASF